MYLFLRSQLQIIAIKIKVVLKQLQELTDLINFVLELFVLAEHLQGDYMMYNVA